MDGLLKIGLIGAGGALGAVTRYLINISPLAHLFERFPFPTFFINVVGSFLIGFFLILLTDKVDINDSLRMGIMIGFLGAFTTFSTFEAEIFGLMLQRQIFVAMTYLTLSIVLGFLGLLAGIGLGRRI